MGSNQDIEKIVAEAVEKATSKNEDALKEERRRSNYLRASQSGQFRSREGIFEYFRAYEGMSLEEALEATDLECKGRGIGESGRLETPEDKPSPGKQIQEEITGFILSSLKNDPAGALQTAGEVIGGAVSLGAGLIAGKKIAGSDEPPAQVAEAIPQPDLPEVTLSPEDI